MSRLVTWKHLNCVFLSVLFILQVLKAHTGLITSTKLFEEMEKLHVIIMDSNPKLQNGEAAESSTSDGYADDIEAEANSYFHQMFSGQLTIEAMVQMLARFKESSVKRYRCKFFCSQPLHLSLFLGVLELLIITLM